MAAIRPAGHGSPWWRDAVICEIDPRSFLDTTGDGTEDLGLAVLSLEIEVVGAQTDLAAGRA